MTAGKIERLFAYQVFPREDANMTGGQVTRHSSLQGTLDNAFNQSKLADGLAIGLNVDPSTRKHDVRDCLLDVAFGSEEDALISAETLASRLAASMDHRSKPSLLAISTHAKEGSGDDRSVILWTFPQQEVFRLSVNSGDTVVRLMDAFNRESSLRKAAYFAGGNSRVDFLGGRVLDSQSVSGAKVAADFWVGKFLNAQLQMGTREGTRFLAQALRKTHEKFASNTAAQTQVHVAVLGIKSSTDGPISLQEIEDKYLSEEVATVFREQVKVDEIRTARFELDRDSFDKQVQYQVYTLRSGVFVSVPFEEIDSSVTVTVDGDERYLQVSGIIEEEKMRARRAQ